VSNSRFEILVLLWPLPMAIPLALFIFSLHQPILAGSFLVLLLAAIWVHRRERRRKVEHHAKSA
jgi:hypothetical protein